MTLIGLEVVSNIDYLVAKAALLGITQEQQQKFIEDNIKYKIYMKHQLN